MATNLEIARAQTIARKTNARLQNIANTYGIQSQTYRDAIAAFSNNTFSGLTRVNKKGVMQITTSGKLLTGSKEGKHLTQIGKRTSTITEYNERAKEEMRKAGVSESEIQELSKSQIHEQTEKMHQISNDFKVTKEEFYNLFDESQRRQIAPNLYNHDGLSYADLQQIQDNMLNAMNGEWQPVDDYYEDDLPFM